MWLPQTERVNFLHWMRKVRIYSVLSTRKKLIHYCTCFPPQKIEKWSVIECLTTIYSPVHHSPGDHSPGDHSPGGMCHDPQPRRSQPRRSQPRSSVLWPTALFKHGFSSLSHLWGIFHVKNHHNKLNWKLQQRCIVDQVSPLQLQRSWTASQSVQAFIPWLVNVLNQVC